MPFYLYITKGYGITIDEINWGCPKDFEPYVNAMRLEEKKKDENSWTLGIYMQSAVTVAVEHCLAGKKAKAEYMKKPLSAQLEEERRKKEISEEEKKKQTEAFFMGLKIMKSNFDREKSRKEEANNN